MDGYAYKRRKLYGNSFALLSEENATSKKLSSYASNIKFSDNLLMGNKDYIGVSPIVTANDCSLEPLDNGNLFISGYRYLPKPAAVFNSLLESVPRNLPDNIGSMGEDKVSSKASNGYFENSETEHVTNKNGSFSSSEGNMKHGSTSMNMDIEMENSAISSDSFKKLRGEFTSSKEFCLYVLNSHGLLRVRSDRSMCHSELLRSIDKISSQSCKVCGRLGHPSKMLICDLCEEAFHLSCFNPKLKHLPTDHWYCQSCLSKNPKHLLQNFNGRSLTIKDTKSDPTKRSYLDRISLMLKEDQAYTTGVRIGVDFQLEVPVFSGPNAIDHAYFGEPAEMDPGEFTDPNGWSRKKSNSIGNWIQCREMIKNDEDGQEIICGKWRRAPLSLLQTDDWECSCAVGWDPAHADCAVPQELTTDEVLQQLKYVEKVRTRHATEKSHKSK